MAETGIRLRLIIIVFSLACLSVAFSSVLLISYWLSPADPKKVEPLGDPLGAVESDLHSGKFSLAWDGLSRLSQRNQDLFGNRAVNLLWKTWEKDPRPVELREITRQVFEKTSKDDVRALISYLLLEAGQGVTIASLSRPGYWSSVRPELESEIALFRGNFSTPRYSILDGGNFTEDTRLELDRAYAWGYLGDFTAARIAASRVIDLTDAPGQNGSTGRIDLNRGICRRQAARIIQIMSVWDSAEPNFESLMHTALVELMVDPDGLVQVAPSYFDVLCDVAAWTGDRKRLEILYRTTDTFVHQLSDAQQETRSILDDKPLLRPETHADIRRILVNGEQGDPRGLIPDLNEAAGKHDDQRSWRLIAWYYLKTGDESGLINLLGRSHILHGPWHSLYQAVVDEKNGKLDSAYSNYQAARKGGLEQAALLNQARLLLLQGRVESAADLAAAARQGVEVRSIGLFREKGSPYASLYADALALQSRILRIQGRASEAQILLRSLSQIDPGHSELYNAKGLEITPENYLEKIQ